MYPPRSPRALTSTLLALAVFVRGAMSAEFLSKHWARRSAPVRLITLGTLLLGALVSAAVMPLVAGFVWH